MIGLIIGNGQLKKLKIILFFSLVNGCISSSSFPPLGSNLEWQQNLNKINHHKKENKKNVEEKATF